MPKYNVKGTDDEGSEVGTTVTAESTHEILNNPGKFGFNTVSGIWPFMEDMGHYDKSAVDLLLNGKCPTCRDKVSELKLNSQGYTHRVLCLGCKRTGDDFTFGRAYLKFIYGEQG